MSTFSNFPRWFRAEASLPFRPSSSRVCRGSPARGFLGLEPHLGDNITTPISRNASSSRISIDISFFEVLPFSAIQRLRSKPGHRTGSKPPGCNGWQRTNRRKPIHTPRRTPCRSTASRMYSEHVGWKRHAEGNSGEIQYLYTRREPVMIRCIAERGAPSPGEAPASVRRTLCVVD